MSETCILPCKIWEMILIVHHIDLRLPLKFLWQLFLYKEHLCLLGHCRLWQRQRRELNVLSGWETDSILSVWLNLPSILWSMANPNFQIIKGWSENCNNFPKDLQLERAKNNIPTLVCVTNFTT